jgi:hypothetical protein
MENRGTTKMIDVVIVSTPRIAPVRPAAAPPLLKTLCNKANKTSRVLDLNQDFYKNFVSANPEAGQEIDNYFITNDTELSNPSFELYVAWIKQWINTILTLEPNIIAISVFSWQSQKMVHDLTRSIRPLFKGKIIVGGQGLEFSQNMSSHWSPRASFGQQLLENNLVDYFLKGEAEETFVQFLQGADNIRGLNKHTDVVLLEDANQIPIGDFSDLDLNNYNNGVEGGVIPIESCRGCVRSCSFCEMSGEHGAYRSKNGAVLANEIIHYYETYNVRHFYFHDDLMNGNLKEFRTFITNIIEYYQKNNLPDRFFSFSGYWIIRNQKQFDETFFELFYRAGANTLVTGVETGSDRLRKKMRKGFSTKDLEFNLEQISKLKLKFYFMLISGLPGETADDFQETLDCLTRWQKYVANGSIIGINLGTTATIEPGTDIFKNYKNYNIMGLKGQPPSGINWMCTETPELDYKERVRRRVALQEHVLSLGYPLWKGDDHLKIILDQYKVNIDMWKPE